MQKSKRSSVLQIGDT